MHKFSQPFVSGSCFLCRLRNPVAPFPMWSALPPRSTMERSDSPSPIRCPSVGWYTLPCGETTGPPRFLASLFLRATLFDPGRPSRISPISILRCRLPTIERRRHLHKYVSRLNRFGECGLPCGPQDSLCTLRTVRSFALHCILLPVRNTRYGWLARPCPPGTPTPEEMPSSAWRTLFHTWWSSIELERWLSSPPVSFHLRDNS